MQIRIKDDINITSVVLKTLPKNSETTAIQYATICPFKMKINSMYESL